MRAEIKINDAIFQIDLTTGHSIARTNPVNADTASFDLQNHQIEALPWRSENLIGAIKQGGSCNVNVLKVNPRCAGTHTEMITVPPEVDDGGYLISLQVPPVCTDAMLSRPVLFELQKPYAE